MAYDWTKHIGIDTLEGRAVEGGGGRRAVVMKTLSPKGFLKLNTGMSFVIDSLSYFEGDEREYVIDLLMWVSELDEEWPFLTHYNRHGLRDVLPRERNSGAAPLTFDGDDDGV